MVKRRDWEGFWPASCDSAGARHSFVCQTDAAAPGAPADGDLECGPTSRVEAQMALHQIGHASIQNYESKARPGVGASTAPITGDVGQAETSLLIEPPLEEPASAAASASTARDG